MLNARKERGLRRPVTNLERVQSLYRYFNRRRIGTVVKSLDPEIVFEPGPEAGPYRRVCRGREEVVLFFDELAKAVRRYRADPIYFFDEGSEVYVLVRMYARFKGGIEAWLPVLHRWTIRDHRIVAWGSFPGRGKPFEALVLELREAGLRETEATVARRARPHALTD